MKTIRTITTINTVLAFSAFVLVAPDAMGKDKVSRARSTTRQPQQQQPQQPATEERALVAAPTAAPREPEPSVAPSPATAEPQEKTERKREKIDRAERRRAEEEEDDDEDKKDSGLSLAVRAGYALPMGSVAKDASLDGVNDLSKYVGGMAPLWLDVGYRITPNWYVGGYFQFALLSTSGDICKRAAGNSACSSSGNDIRFGGMGRYTFRPQAKFAPWIGVSTGYEITSLSVTAGTQTADTTVKGFEFIGLHVGGDVRVGRDFTVGPVVNASFGQYTSSSRSNAQGSASTDFNNTALHQWVFLGVKGQYDL
jgi:hypothetical protein